MKPSVDFQNIGKAFGTHQVLKNVCFKAFPGDVIALMGENGAGKSTLMRILCGVYEYSTYTGKFLIQDQEACFQSVPESKKNGIAMVHQELGLFPELTVAENIYLDHIGKTHSWRIPKKKIEERCHEFLQSLGFDLKASELVSNLSTGQAQLVEIARAIESGASVLILDEPTSALSEKEVTALFTLIKKLQHEGKTIFYVSHRMEEIRKISNRVVVLRDGEIAGEGLTKELTTEKLVEWMVGRKVEDIYPKRIEALKKSKPLLKIKNLSLKGTHKDLLKNISLEIQPGEILGIGGLMGSGRSELMLTVFGASHLVSNHPFTGDIEFNDEKIQNTNPKNLISKGISLLSEDRKELGLFLNRPAKENISLSFLKKINSKNSSSIFIDHKTENEYVSSQFSDLKIKGPGPDFEVENYSGGNQQKIYLSRCLSTKPKVLILDEPTRGVDIGAKIEIYNLIRKLSNAGVAIFLISSEMPELLGLSDRILVMKGGEIVKEFPATQNHFSAEEIIKAASAIPN